LRPGIRFFFDGEGFRRKSILCLFLEACFEAAGPPPQADLASTCLSSYFCPFTSFVNLPAVQQAIVCAFGHAFSHKRSSLRFLVSSALPLFAPIPVEEFG
jgi:hypothetical protein